MRTSPKPKSPPPTPVSSLPSKVRSRLSKLVEQKLDIQDQLDLLESMKRSVLDELSQLSVQNSLPTIQGEGWRLTEPQTRITRSLSETKLLEHGVPLKVIQACTEEKESKPYVKVERTKESVLLLGT